MKKIVLLTFTGILMVCLIYQGSMAFYHAETQVGAKVSAGRLGIELVETTDEEKAIETDDGYHFTSVMPGAVLQNKAYIKNVKDKTLYVRVTAKKFWEDQNGDKLHDADSSLIQLYTEHQEDWIIIDDAENSNGENMYYYYKKPIMVNERSTNIYDSIKIDSELNDLRYKDYRVRIALEADAIQSAAVEDAVLSEWGVEIILDEQGNIIAVEE